MAVAAGRFFAGLACCAGLSGHMARLPPGQRGPLLSGTAAARGPTALSGPPVARDRGGRAAAAAALGAARGVPLAARRGRRAAGARPRAVT